MTLPERAPKTRRRVAVAGGGNVAVDCARTVLRMGSREVTVVYRRTREEMPARTEEIAHAGQEGVQFRCLTSPVRYFGDDQERVRQLKCVPMKPGKPDASGRPRPLPIAGSTYLLEVDLVLVAVDAGSNPTLFEGCDGLERSGRGYLRTFNEAGRTGLSRVWAGGGRSRRVALRPPGWSATHTGVASRAGAPGRRRRGAPPVPSIMSRTE